MQVPRFTASPNFYNDLKSRVNQYFVETNQSPTGNWRLYTKATILTAAMIILYVVLVFFTPSTPWAIALCVVAGFVTAAHGFNVMHDGCHGSFSKSKKINTIAGYTLSILGGNDFMWKLKHNVMHHGFTNVHGYDDDIEVRPFFRMCPTQTHKWFHRFQATYSIVLYSLLYVLWMLFFDYKKYFTGKIGSFDVPKMKTGDHIAFWAGKIVSTFIFLIFPIIKLGFAKAIVGFLIFTLLTGFLLTIVFQLAHVVEETEFPMPTDECKIENEWAIHQIQTTANFATRNPIVTWFCGGLNFQIEHHLFPSVSHIHYPKISRIVKQVCSEYGVAYVEFPRISTAVHSHFKLLHDLGRA